MDLLETVIVEPSDDNLRLPIAFFGVSEPPLVRSIQPAEYPVASDDSVSVVVDVLVTREGRADSVRVFDGMEPYASEAIRAVEAYRFYSAENRKEEALNVWVEVVIPFAPPAVPAAASADVLAPESATEVTE